MHNRNRHYRLQRWKWAATALVLASIAGNSRLQAQALFSTAAAELDRAGFGLYDVSAFSSFSNSYSPILNPSTGTIIPDFSFHTLSSGISTSVGWRTRKSSSLSFAVRYTASYYYQTSSTGFSSSRFVPSQNFSTNWSKLFGTKWTVSASVSGSMGDYNQMLLLPNGEQSLVGLPGTSAAFGNAVLTGTTGASAALAAQQSLLYGGRFLNAAGTVSASYAFSPRLTLTGSATGNRMQHLSDSGTSAQSLHLIPQTTGLSGGLGLSYAVSPRTSVNANVTYSRAVSSLASAPSASIMVGASRKITEHLFTRFGAGAGYLLPYGQGTSAIGLQRTQWQAMGSVGYQLFRQSFVVSANRTASDNYGVGATATLMVSGGWSWRPGANWGINAGGTDLRLQGSQFGRNGYNLNAGIHRSLASRFSLNMNYGYGSFSVGALAIPGLSQALQYRTHSVRLSLSWHPYLGSPDVDSTAIDNSIP
jgi:hypothetical protein